MASSTINITSYKTETVNNLPWLVQAHAKLTSGKVSITDVCNEVGKIFGPGMVYTFGLTLLHKPFDLKANEKLVHIDNQVLPLTSPANTVPISWRATADGSMTPYEFSNNALDLDGIPAAKSKLARLSSYLHQNKLEDDIGVCLLPAGWIWMSRRPQMAVIGDRVVHKSQDQSIEAVVENINKGVPVLFGCKSRGRDLAIALETVYDADVLARATSPLPGTHTDGGSHEQ